MGISQAAAVDMCDFDTTKSFADAVLLCFGPGNCIGTCELMMSFVNFGFRQFNQLLSVDYCGPIDCLHNLPTDL
jgi:hypothetical protein